MRHKREGFRLLVREGGAWHVKCAVAGRGKLGQVKRRLGGWFAFRKGRSFAVVSWNGVTWIALQAMGLTKA